MNITVEYASPQIYYSLACFMFIIIGVMGAAVRWLHMCHPYDEQGEYFYPARRQAAFFYAAVILQLPYVLCPSNPDVWLYVRTIGIVYYPVCFAMLFQRYFRRERLSRNWQSKLFFFMPFLLMIGMLGVVLFGPPNMLSRHQRIVEWGMGGLSLLMSCQFLRECRWLGKCIDEYHTQNFSNESDFPYVFAKKVLYLPLIWFTVMWVVFLSCSRNVKMVVDVVFALWMIRFLCQILHPNKIFRTMEKEKKMEQMEREDMEVNKEITDTFEQVAQELEPQDFLQENQVAEASCDDQKQEVNPDDWEAVKKEVLTIVSKRYLEQNLKRVDVIRNVTFMKHTMAGNFITQIGFYKLVNAFRIRHYEKLVAEKSPNLSLEAMAEMCGFKNRWALANARKRLGDFDYGLIEKYV